MDEKLEELLRRIGILKNELIATSMIAGETKPNPQRKQAAIDELMSISASSTELPIARYAAARAVGIKPKRNFNYEIKLWLHEDAAGDIAALGVIAILAGVTALFCYGSYRIIN